jgi:pyruvate dehydrogenase E2 component (dihydrolipoamide acetyltransferase)
MMVTVEDVADVAAFADYVLDPAAAAAPPAPAAPAVVHAVAAPVAAPAPVAVAVSAPSPSSSAPTGSRVVASPLARKILRDAGLPATALEGIQGTGSGGRVVSADVIARIAAGVPAATAAPVQSHSPAAKAAAHMAPAQVISVPGVYSDFELSDLARAVAARQTAAMQQVPHYYLSVELNLAKLISLREELNRSSNGIDLSVLDFIVKASALAVEQVQCIGSIHSLSLRFSPSLSFPSCASFPPLFSNFLPLPSFLRSPNYCLPSS